MKKIALFIITLILFVSCEDNPVGSLSDKAMVELEKWKSLGINNYSITQQRIANFTGSDKYVRVYVSNNVITDIRDSSGTTSIPSENWKWYKSVDQLFDILIDTKNTRPSYYDVLYHDTYHYPAVLSLGPGTAKQSEAYTFLTIELFTNK
ncbi:MAG: hypothetical protein GYA14_14940 [Ignavibacteria bacterium]|nr:hypothetical protein [Ignavibacteria bacterium]